MNGPDPDDGIQVRIEGFWIQGVNQVLEDAVEAGHHRIADRVGKWIRFAFEELGGINCIGLGCQVKPLFDDGVLFDGLGLKATKLAFDLGAGLGNHVVLAAKTPFGCDVLHQRLKWTVRELIDMDSTTIAEEIFSKTIKAA